MTEATSQGKRPQNIDVIADEVPERVLGAAAKRRLRKLARALDEVGRLDEESGEVLLYEPALKRFLEDRELLPEAVGRNAVAALRNPDAEKALTKEDKGKRLSWGELVERAGGPKPDRDLGFRALGLRESSSEEEMREAVKRNYPDLPQEAFEGDELRRRIEAVLREDAQPRKGAVTAVPRDAALWWDCVTRSLGGFWIWILAGALVAFLAALPNVWLGVILAGAWLGFWALGIAIVCAFSSF